MAANAPILKVASLNMGYNVMCNRVKGSEAPFVALCQSVYPKYGGWANQDAAISAGTYNSAVFLSDYDLFGLQEINVKYQEPFEDVLISIGEEKHRDYRFINSYYFGGWAVTVGYDQNKLGEGVQITPNDFSLGSSRPRGLQAVYFPDHELLFINLHAPHNINLKQELDYKGKQIEKFFAEAFGDTEYKVKRIIMAGDFNDDSGSLLNQTINMFGLNIKLPVPGHKVPKTCCTDTNYIYVGDYILDSNPNNGNIYFGLPLGYNRKTDLYSDHDPVVLIDDSGLKSASYVKQDTLIYKISAHDILEASTIRDHPNKTRSLRIISDGTHIVQLGLVNDEELNQLVKMLDLKIVI